MPVNLIVGGGGGDVLNGASGDDLIYGYDPDAAGSDTGSIAATRVASGLNSPLFAGSPPHDPTRLFIVEKNGLIKILDLETQTVLATPFLDVSAEITITGEQGLLGLAFDPGFAQNGYVYVNLINLAGDTEIRRYQVSSADPNRADPASASVVITVDQPAGPTNHRAGWLGFGPDGLLYASIGDGGVALNSQDINGLLGKILRLDVRGDDFPGDPLRNYAIPPDNMFVGVAGADEIFALGLRNPWRPSFDRGLGDFYIADVGASAWEEINAGLPGRNYGWPHFEGPDPALPGTPNGGILTFPLYSYDHGVGQSITGGYVYRGASDGLQGRYFFADFIAQKIFTLDLIGGVWTAVDRTAEITADVGAIGLPASFGEDAAGNLYVVDILGEVFRLTPGAALADLGDVIDGMAGNDRIFGGPGGDLLHGGVGDDTVHGGAGIDEIDGGDGADLLFGDAERDVIAGGAGNDTLDGGAGDDSLMGGPGADALVGGAGFDTATYSNAAAAVVVGLSGWTNFGEAAGDRFRSVDGVFGSAFNDLIGGDGLANGLWGQTGDDTLWGYGAGDWLLGMDGNDGLNGGAGADLIDGGNGWDTALYDHATSGVVAGLSGWTNFGEAAGDTFNAVEGIYATDFGDYLGGDANANALYGRGGADSLYGYGGGDYLIGGTGADTLYGGAGGDIFYWAAGDGADFIADFQAGAGAGDVLSLQGTGYTSLAQMVAGGIVVQTPATTQTELRLPGATIYIWGVTPGGLAADDFLFV